MVVIRTVHPSDWTSIEYATAGSVLAIVPLALPSGIGTPCPFQPKKGGTPTLAIGAGIPPENSKKAGASPALLRWLFCVFKRSISGYQATATGSFALLRLRFGFSALTTASASATASVFSASGSGSAVCVSPSSFWLSAVNIGITTR